MMRSTPLALGLILGLGLLQIQTPPPEAYPGQRNHKEPPAGWFCSPNSKQKSHICHCKRMSSPTKEDPICEDTPVIESPQCAVFCWKWFCRCDVTCELPEHHHMAVKK